MGVGLFYAALMGSPDRRQPRGYSEGAPGSVVVTPGGDWEECEQRGPGGATFYEGSAASGFQRGLALRSGTVLLHRPPQRRAPGILLSDDDVLTLGGNLYEGTLLSIKCV